MVLALACAGAGSAVLRCRKASWAACPPAIYLVACSDSPAQDEGHIKWPSLRAELAMNLICLRPDRRPDVGAWLVLGVSPNIYKLKATLCGLLCLRKVCPGILVWNGMQFPLGTRLGKCVPLFSWIPGCIFRLRLVGKVRPGLGAQTGMDFPDEGLTENVSRSGR